MDQLGRFCFVTCKKFGSSSSRLCLMINYAKLQSVPNSSTIPMQPQQDLSVVIYQTYSGLHRWEFIHRIVYVNLLGTLPSHIGVSGTNCKKFVKFLTISTVDDEVIPGLQVQSQNMLSINLSKTNKSSNSWHKIAIENLNGSWNLMLVSLFCILLLYISCWYYWYYYYYLMNIERLYYTQ